MKRRSVVVNSSAHAGILLLAYVASYFAIRIGQPGCINTHDGPISAFNMVYYPLRYLDARKPEWYSIARSQGGCLSATIDGNNLGNGYLYFTWNGQEARAFNLTSQHFEKGESVQLHFKFDLETWDDFSTRLVPSIDDIAPVGKSVVD